jgi:hypothetical protein
MVLDKPDQIEYLRFLTVMQGIKLTRVATPSNMRKWATEYTGKEYKRSRQGLEAALLDMEAIHTKQE